MHNDHDLFQNVLYSEVPRALYLMPHPQAISSGYIMEDIADPAAQGSECCRITYLHQLGSSVMPFFSKDLLGVSTLMEKICLSMRRFLQTES